MVCEFDFTELKSKDEKDQEILHMLSKDGLTKSAREDYYEVVQSVNRYVISALVRSEPVLKVIRRELKKLADGVKVDIEHIEEILINESLKRDVVNSEEAESAQKVVEKFYRSNNRSSRRSKNKSSSSPKKPAENQGSVTERLLKEADDK